MSAPLPNVDAPTNAELHLARERAFDQLQVTADPAEAERLRVSLRAVEQALASRGGDGLA